MKKVAYIVVVLIFVNLTSLLAQDAHYWTEQFGSQSVLLTGNVIGSVEDLGSVFYNPARLALQEKPTFLLSAKAYQLVTLKVKDGIGQADLTNDKFGAAPALIAGNFDLKGVKWLKKLHNHKFAYSFMSRYGFDYTLNARVNRTYEFNGDWVGEEELYGSFIWNKTFSEEWLGLTWAIPINESWSVGITNFLTVTNQNAIYQFDLQALGESTNGDNQVAILTRNRDRSMNHIGYVAKVGLSYVQKRISLGLTITTPKAHIMGSGNMLFEELLAGYENSEKPLSNNILESNVTDNVDVVLKSPWGIGFGSGLSFGKHILHVSAEWYSKVDKYYVFVPEPFVGQTSGEIIRSRYVDERKSVLNYGLGVEWGLTDSLKFYTSFSTDFSSLVINNEEDISKRVTDGLDNSIFTTNIYNYGGGVSWSLKKMELTIGMTYSRGIQPVPKLVRFPEDTNDPVSDPDNIEYTDMLWERWRVLVGFSLPINKSDG